MAEGGRNVEEDDVAEWLRRQPRKLFRETGREFKSHRRRGSFFFLPACSPASRALSVAGCLCLVACSIDLGSAGFCVSPRAPLFYSGS